MSEGRKTRRFKETNEKAELDRQWKKISAVSLQALICNSVVFQKFRCGGIKRCISSEQLGVCDYIYLLSAIMLFWQCAS